MDGSDHRRRPGKAQAVDRDGDGFLDQVEIAFGSDPNNPASTPENAQADAAFGLATCTDGIDNDGDKLVDGSDPECADTQPTTTTTTTTTTTPLSTPPPTPAPTTTTTEVPPAPGPAPPEPPAGPDPAIPSAPPPTTPVPTGLSTDTTEPPATTTTTSGPTTTGPTTTTTATVPTGVPVGASGGTRPGDAQGPTRPDGSGFPWVPVVGVMAGAGFAATSVVGWFWFWRWCRLAHTMQFHKMELTVEPVGRRDSWADDPLPLKASARDTHVLVHSCFCGRRESRRNLFLQAKVAYTWEMLEGEGGFISINDETPAKKTFGAQVLFQPPDVEDTTTVKKVKMKVIAYHLDETKTPDHDPCQKTLELEIRRHLTDVPNGSETAQQFTDPGEVVDALGYTIRVIDESCPGTIPPPPELREECEPQQKWLKGGALRGSIVLAPAEAAYGDHVRLEAVGRDTDELELRCTPTGDRCTRPAVKRIILSDLLEFQWTASGGTFPRGNIGREVVWRAPDQEGDVAITVRVRDVGGQFDDEDATDAKTIAVRKLGIDLVQTPAAWLPEATEGRLRTTTRIYMCKGGKWVAGQRKKLVRTKLLRVSRERGVCMNYPRNGNNTNPDLFFHEAEMRADWLFRWDKTVADDCPTGILVANDNPAHDEHYLYALARRRTSEASVVVRCEDYGAVGVVGAWANHCVLIPARAEANAEPCPGAGCCEGGAGAIIPRDGNGNDIADSAPQDAAGAAANTDNENNPRGDGTRGDGLTNYEEYRGFIVGGGANKAHRRTSVVNKDVFVYDEDGLGTGMFDETGLTIHVLTDEDLFNGTGSRVINFNRGRHSGGDQHGIWLRNHAIAGVYGRACGGANGPPRTKTHVCINQPLCIAAGEPADRLNNTIAHELAHAVDVDHHGNAGNHAHAVGGVNLQFNNAGGLTSGVENCISRYDRFAVGWDHDAAHHQHQTYFAGGVWLENPGTAFCNDDDGTGTNSDGGHRNDASAGNCLGQIRVKDW